MEVTPSSAVDCRTVVPTVHGRRDAEPLRKRPRPFALPLTGANRYECVLANRYRVVDTTLPDRRTVMREIARYATMAPNSHNTQPWRMSICENELTISPDFSRRCPVVDPDDHHIFVTLGCAAENAVQAALAFGLEADCRFDAETDSIRIHFEPCQAKQTDLFHAVPFRQTSRCEFDGAPLSQSELTELVSAANDCATQSNQSVKLLLFTGREQIDAITQFVVEGNRQQMLDPAFVSELKHWIRFSYSNAIERGDGLFGISTGSPAVPEWIGKRLFDFVFRISSETKKYERQMRSSTGVAVFIGKDETKSRWIDVGRSFERFALQATEMGVLHSHVNQPVEVPSIRNDFANWLGVPDSRPDLVIRFGRGTPMPKSLRRPLDAVVRERSAPISVVPNSWNDGSTKEEIR